MGLNLVYDGIFFPLLGEMSSDLGAPLYPLNGMSGWMAFFYYNLPMEGQLVLPLLGERGDSESLKSTFEDPGSFSWPIIFPL